MSRLKRETWDRFLRDPGEETFGVLYDETRDLVHTLCYRILGTEADAADALQATYCRVLALARGRPRVARIGDAAAGVSRLAVREADALRHRLKRRARKEVAMGSADIGGDRETTPEGILARKELRERIETLVASLPDRLRVPLLLHYFDGLTHDEVAGALGISKSAVSNRIARGVRRLQPAARRERLGELTGILGSIAAGSALLAPSRPLGAAEVWARTSAAGAPAVAGGAIAAIFEALGAAKLAAVSGAAAAALAAGIAAFVSIASPGGPGPEERVSPPALAGGGEVAGEPEGRPEPAGPLLPAAPPVAVPGDGRTLIFGRITIAGRPRRRGGGRRDARRRPRSRGAGRRRRPC